MPEKLNVGDKVLWSGGWGRESAREATITDITIAEGPGSKEGPSVESVPWTSMQGESILVGLDNKHWAYGYQIQPLPDDWPVDSIEEPCETGTTSG